VKLLFVASEAAPFAKSGGLGDVLSALPRALAARGHEVLVVLPRYGQIEAQRFGLRDTGRRVEVPFPDGPMTAAVHVTAPAERLRYLLLAHPVYARRGLYGEEESDYRDNHRRFALLSVGALEAARQFGFAPDVVHAHDWQAALTPLVIKRGWAGRPSPVRARTVFTAHNLAFQGLFPREAMQELALPFDLFNPDALEFYGQIALIKAGLVFADRLTTVSPTYAKEIVRSPELGAGLDGLLRWRKSDLTGILNGADYSFWNPETDTNLPARYSAGDLSGKATCKEALQRELGLTPDAAAPLCVAIGRFAHHKGYDLLAQGLPALVERGCQVAILGQGNFALEQELTRLAQKHAGKIALAFRFDDPLAHRFEAGADVFLMPSRSEPCGLNQLYSLRYGTLPLVHAVGGLADSIVEAAAPGAAPGSAGWGFRFDDPTVDSMLAAADRMLALWRDRGAAGAGAASGSTGWTACMRRAMALDFSWDRAASEYEAVYRGERP
jgi:starch synthase